METVPEYEWRRRFMSILAQASPADVDHVWRTLENRPAHRIVRGPEVGTVMVRGRAGGTGAAFNLGEMTITRCTVALEDGQVGHAYVGGRSPVHAEQAAVLDAMLQDAGRRERLEATVIALLAERREALRQCAARRAAATQVEFFTMVRGEE